MPRSRDYIRYTPSRAKDTGANRIAQAVFLDKSLPYEVRYLAIIQLKNGIDKYWRKTAPKYVTLRYVVLLRASSAAMRLC